jgi:SAM-dependent methyltransferase
MTGFDYDSMRDLYEADLNSAVSFSGRDHDFFMRAKARVIVDVARRRLGDPSGLAALDVGCGLGLLDRHVEGAFGSTTGTDLAPGVLEDAAKANPGVRYELSEVDRLAFEDASFDLAFTANVIQLQWPAAVAPFVAEIARVVRPGGLVIALEHNPLNPLTRFVVRRASLGRDVKGLIGRTRLARLLRQAGLKVEERRYLLLTPWELRPLLALERLLGGLPFGAQHYAVGRRV